MNHEENAVELLREYLNHHDSPLECGNAYISREFADADKAIMLRIRSFLDSKYPDGPHDDTLDIVAEIKQFGLST